MFFNKKKGILTTDVIFLMVCHDLNSKLQKKKNIFFIIGLIDFFKMYASIY